jgi:VanZ family protein
MLEQSLDWLGFHLTALGLDTLNHVLRKTGHFIGYATLSLLFWRAWYRTLRDRTGESRLGLRLRCTGLALLGTLITASLDEWHQSFIPSRNATPVDVALDMTGAVAAHLILFAILWFMGRPRRGTPEAYA